MKPIAVPLPVLEVEQTAVQPVATVPDAPTPAVPADAPKLAMVELLPLPNGLAVAVSAEPVPK